MLCYGLNRTLLLCKKIWHFTELIIELCIFDEDFICPSSSQYFATCLTAVFCEGFKRKCLFPFTRNDKFRLLWRHFVFANIFQTFSFSRKSPNHFWRAKIYTNANFCKIRTFFSSCPACHFLIVSQSIFAKLQKRTFSFQP